MTTKQEPPICEDCGETLAMAPPPINDYYCNACPPGSGLKRHMAKARVILDGSNKIRMREVGDIIAQYKKAIQVFGSIQEADKWMSSTLLPLDHKTPLEAMRSEAGRVEVSNLLDKLQTTFLA